MARHSSPQVVRVRIAPSPTGIPHIGNTRSFLYNFLFAKKKKGTFVLRIEDTDRERLVPGSENKIKEILSWLGLKPDEEYKQSERLEIYKEHSQILKAGSMAYEDDGALRFRMPKSGRSFWKDEVGAKEISFENKEQEDFVIIKSDGYPTYNFANVVDDHLINITHVIRGEEFISSTPKHIQLYKAFGWKHPIFAHLPVILGKDKGKLSKRYGAETVLEYREKGYLKEAILNYMALLGWNPGGDREIMSIEEMIDLFELSHVNTSNPVFDTTKLEWMNSVYIRKTQNSELKTQMEEIGEDWFDIFDEGTVEKLIEVAKTRVKTLKGFKEEIEPFSKKQITSKPELRAKIFDTLSKISKWDKDEIAGALKKLNQREKTSFKDLYKAIIGREQGLPLGEVFEILGKEETLKLLS